METKVAAHIHDLLNKLTALQARIYMEQGVDACNEALDSAVEEVRALAKCLQESDIISPKEITLLKPFLTDLKKQSTPEMSICVNAMIEASSVVYCINNDLQLVLDELIRNSAKAHAKRLFISVSERGGHTYKILFHDDGDGMLKQQVDNLGFGPKKEGCGGHGVGLLRNLVHGMGGHINWLPTAERFGGGTLVALTLEKGEMQ